MATASLSRHTARPVSPSVRNRRVTGLLVFGIALAARLAMPAFGGGLRGHYSYDAPVYYAAGMGVVQGQLPYRDFILVHPPLIAVATAPFAALGVLTTDQVGFIAANLAFTFLGAFNAVLVLRLTRQLGLGRTAAVTAALFYAVWNGSVTAEFQIRLEPLGNTLLLLSLLALLAAMRRADGSRLLLLAGLLLGLAVNVKIWWAAPAVVVVGWALAHGVRRAAAVAAGGAAVVLLLDVPMLLLTRGNMWTMAVTAQVERSDDVPSLWTRLWTLGGAIFLESDPKAVVLGAVVLVVLAGLAAAAWRIPPCRLVLLIGVVQLAVLILEPSWHTYYPDYFAVALCVGIAGGVGWLQTRPGLRRFALPLAGVLVVSSLALTMMLLTSTATHLLEPEPDGARLGAAVAGASCVLSDSPMALIATNTLHHSFGPDCRNWVDVRGMNGRASLLGSALVDPAIRPGLANYLTSGGTVLLDRHDPMVTPQLVSQVRAVVRLVPVGHYLVSEPGGSPGSG